MFLRLILDNGLSIGFEQERMDNFSWDDSGLVVRFLDNDKYFEITDKENVEDFISQIFPITIVSDRDRVDKLKGK